MSTAASSKVKTGPGPAVPVVPPQGAAPQARIEEPIGPRVPLTFAPPLAGEPSQEAKTVRIERQIHDKQAFVARLEAHRASFERSGNPGPATPPGGAPLPAADDLPVAPDALDTAVFISLRIDKANAEILALHDEMNELQGPQADGAAMQAAKAAQRRVRKAAQKLAAQEVQPMDPATRVQQAQAAGRPEVTALVKFIVKHFGQRELPQADESWQAIAQWKGFADMHRDAQALALDFSQLTGDQRNASGILAQAAGQLAQLRDQPAARSAPEVEAEPMIHLPPASAAPEAAQAEHRDYTALERYVKWESTVKRETVNQLASFMAGHLRQGGPLQGASKLQEWPGFEDLDQPARKLGEKYLKLKPAPQAQQTRVGRSLEALLKAQAARPPEPEVKQPSALSDAETLRSYRFKSDAQLQQLLRELQHSLRSRSLMQAGLHQQIKQLEHGFYPDNVIRLWKLAAGPKLDILSGLDAFGTGPRSRPVTLKPQEKSFVDLAARYLDASKEGDDAKTEIETLEAFLRVRSRNSDPSIQP